MKKRKPLKKQTQTQQPNKLTEFLLGSIRVLCIEPQLVEGNEQTEKNAVDGCVMTQIETEKNCKNK